jgi:hypothetical protein
LWRSGAELELGDPRRRKAELELSDPRLCDPRFGGSTSVQVRGSAVIEW